MRGCRCFRIGAWVIPLVPLLLSCVNPKAATGGGRDLPIRVIRSSLVCEGSAKGARVTWITDGATFRRVLNADRPLGMPGGPTAAPTVNFRTEGVLRIEMGMRPTTGYGFEPRAVRAVVAAGTVTVHVTTVAPRPGGIVSQMITSPCILLQMPRGGYKRIRVQDQHGQVLGVVSLGR
jgi:hypothetical protein